MTGSPKFVALAGGVGGAKLADGLVRAAGAEQVTVVVNTADDFTLYGLHIAPDLDTVLYTLSGIANPVTGWGIEGDTHAALGGIARYGRDPWFQVGDRDLATHVLRTEALRAGRTLTDVTAELASALGVRSAILPMTDQPVATTIQTPDGPLEFQDYFVRRRQRDEVIGVAFVGIESARMTDAVAAAIAAADLIVVCPSNPIVSIGPMLLLPGLRDALAAADAPMVAVSPLVGGKALKGPADRMMTSLGHESSAAGVADLYAGLVDAFVLDTVDANLEPRIAALEIRTLVTDTVMRDIPDRARLAAEVVHFGRTLARVPA